MAARALALAVLVAAVGFVFLTGLSDLAHDHDRFVKALQDAGPWGVLVFLAVMTATVAVGVPGIVFVAPVVAAWPAPTAILVFLVGGLMASCMRLAFVRSIGRSWVEARLPERFRSWDERLSNAGIRTVLVVRVVSNLAAPADWALAPLAGALATFPRRYSHRPPADHDRLDRGGPGLRRLARRHVPRSVARPGGRNPGGGDGMALIHTRRHEMERRRE